jgi:hypothetical protein
MREEEKKKSHTGSTELFSGCLCRVVGREACGYDAGWVGRGQVSEGVLVLPRH